MSSKICVSGYGMVTPLGSDAASSWSSLCSEQTAQRGASFAPSKRSNTSSLLRAEELAQSATTEALAQAGLWDGRALQGIVSERVGCIVCASKPLFDTPSSPRPFSISATTPWRTSILRSSSDPATAEDGRQSLNGGKYGEGVWESLSLLHGEGGQSSGKGGISIAPPEAINYFVKHRFGFQGESRNVMAACATGAYSIALGASWIEQGLCDAVVAGSVEPYPHPLIQAGFRQMGVISPEGLTRPFDRRRTGFTIGEGAGVVILESEAHAKGRGAQPYARLSGWALGSDSHSSFAFNSDGLKIAGVIERALKGGGLSPPEVCHVNAHGTATRLNDWIETQALLKAFGSHAAKLMISATKASTGHLLGASGSVEFIFTVLALARQIIPPTATLEEPDQECPLDYTPQKGHSASFDHALSLSFGFGGPIGALVVSLP